MKIRSALVIATTVSGVLQFAQAQCPQICDTENTGLGQNALENNTGRTSTGIGVDALRNNSGQSNTATGYQALKNNRGGLANTAFGARALSSLKSGAANTAVGNAAMANATTAGTSTAVGSAALASSTGDDNAAVGFSALSGNTTGRANTAIGSLALEGGTGSNNTAIGYQTMINNTSGSDNIVIGAGAGNNLTTGSNNIDIVSDGVAGESNTIRIGVPGTHQATYVAGISGVAVADGVSVVVGDDGHLGTLTSSARYKDTIKPMGDASDTILSLKPVTFRYKKELDPNAIPQFGLVAEDVAKVDPELVLNDDQGQPYTVRYEAVNAMLLNEFLKEHKKVEQQTSEIANLKAELQQQKVQAQAQWQEVTARLTAKGL
jgi:Chaperone of endosialidase